ALALTLETRVAHFWSRSRGKLWKKGEESGNLLDVTEVRTDCDQDVVWLKATVSGAGVACHTGARSCFYRSLPLGEPSTPAMVLKRTTGASTPSPLPAHDGPFAACPGQMPIRRCQPRRRFELDLASPSGGRLVPSFLASAPDLRACPRPPLLSTRS